MEKMDIDVLDLGYSRLAEAVASIMETAKMLNASEPVAPVVESGAQSVADDAFARFVHLQASVLEDELAQSPTRPTTTELLYGRPRALPRELPIGFPRSHIDGADADSGADALLELFQYETTSRRTENTLRGDHRVAGFKCIGDKDLRRRLINQTKLFTDGKWDIQRFCVILRDIQRRPCDLCNAGSSRDIWCTCARVYSTPFTSSFCTGTRASTCYCRLLSTENNTRICVRHLHKELDCLTRAARVLVEKHICGNGKPVPYASPEAVVMPCLTILPQAACGNIGVLADFPQTIHMLDVFGGPHVDERACNNWKWHLRVNTYEEFLNYACAPVPADLRRVLGVDTFDLHALFNSTLAQYATLAPRSNWWNSTAVLSPAVVQTWQTGRIDTSKVADYFIPFVVIQVVTVQMQQ